MLSGGGAAGLAHVGVLKALEEKGIPIDFITGTSAGALVGSLYSAGYSPEEIEAFCLSPEFQLMAFGELKPEHRFILHNDEPNPEMASFSFAKDSILNKSLPTNFTSSVYLDFQLLNLLGTVSASKSENFDSLFVPFRCLASDIANKQSIVFSEGDLNKTVRASMTYPFYFEPTRINGVLLFDGGLYNNFPANVMYHDFNPDFIIGSNVTYNAALPAEDDLLSQITNMLVSYSVFELPCDEGIIIEPESRIGSFEFDRIDEAIRIGYESTIARLDSVLCHIDSLVPKEVVQARREAFRKEIVPLSVSSISTNGTKKELKFVQSSMIRSKKDEKINLKQLEKRYFRLYSYPQVDYISPDLSLKEDSTYNLNLEVRKAKEFDVSVGGHVSSRPVNTGYLGLSFKTIGKIPTRTKLESHFGKFYGAAKATFTFELPTIYPISTSLYFTLNRWDYFKSFATFFEDVQPSFLVQNEMYTGLQINLPFSNTIKNTFDIRGFQIDDRYYQTENFTNKDTADHTYFTGISECWSIEKNSLNRKQFATGGHFIKFNFRHIYGLENSISGSTSINDYNVKNYHSWININFEYLSFLVDHSNFHLGVHGQMVYNSQKFFANYTATLLSLTEFSLLPDAKTHFLPEYRSPQYVAGGLNLIFTIKKRIDLRFDGYIFQPFTQLIQNNDGSLGFSALFKGDAFMGSGSVIYHSLVGPLRATMNYFPKQTNPFSFQISFGYVLFNERAIR